MALLTCPQLVIVVAWTLMVLSLLLLLGLSLSFPLASPDISAPASVGATVGIVAIGGGAYNTLLMTTLSL